MEKINGLEKINLDIDFEPEIDLEDDIEEFGDLLLDNIEYMENEFAFEDTLEIDLDEVRENV